MDQFAPHANRPNLILERTGLGPRALVAHFARQHAKRLAKLGLAARRRVPLDAPTAHFEATSVSETGADRPRLRRPRRGVRRYQLFVNEVPTGPAGKPVQGHHAVVEETVELGRGEKKIEGAAATPPATSRCAPSPEFATRSRYAGTSIFSDSAFLATEIGV